MLLIIPAKFSTFATVHICHFYACLHLHTESSKISTQESVLQVCRAGLRRKAIGPVLPEKSLTSTEYRVANMCRSVCHDHTVPLHIGCYTINTMHSGTLCCSHLNCRHVIQDPASCVHHWRAWANHSAGWYDFHSIILFTGFASDKFAEVQIWQYWQSLLYCWKNDIVCFLGTANQSFMGGNKSKLCYKSLLFHACDACSTGKSLCCNPMREASAHGFLLKFSSSNGDLDCEWLFLQNLLFELFHEHKSAPAI